MSDRQKEFNEFANAYGGVLAPDSSELDPQSQPWINRTFAGLPQITQQFEGLRNQNGAKYNPICGIFNNDDFVAAAEKRRDFYCLGCSIGVALRCLNAWLVITSDSTNIPAIPEVMNWLLGAHPDDQPSEDYSNLIDTIVRQNNVIKSCRAAFFTVSFVWMHETFHTLLGHTDFTATALGIGINEQETLETLGSYMELMQGLELQADSAALSNLMVRAVRFPEFGMGVAPDSSPVAVVAEVGAAAFLALIALEVRRSRQNFNIEILHPFPIRRVSALKRLVLRLETSGHLPAGSDLAISRNLSMIRSKFSGVYGSQLLDVAIGNIGMQEDDLSRLDYLGQRYGAEIKTIEMTSFVPKSY